MSSVLVNYRLTPERPLRLTWLATDGSPGDGYKAQITGVRIGEAVIALDGYAILEHATPDPQGGDGAFVITFNGMVGYGEDHPDREVVQALPDLAAGASPGAASAEVPYVLTFVHEDTGRLAVEGKDYRIVEQPPALAHRIGGGARPHA